MDEIKAINMELYTGTITIPTEEYRELTDKAARLDAITDGIRQKVDAGSEGYARVDDDLVLLLTGTFNYKRPAEQPEETKED